MSVEVVTGRDGRLYVLDGSPADGYEVCPVGDPIARYDRKYEARYDLHHGHVGVDE